MKKLILSVSVLSVLGISFKLGTAQEPDKNKTEQTTTESSATSTASTFASAEAYIKNLYSQIDFGGEKKLAYDVFEKAYKGYVNLRNAGKLNADKDILTIVDFSKSSTEERLWVINLGVKKLVFNDYVAHGQGSGSEYAKAFSNTTNSHQSSLGFYVTAETYHGKHGLSLRMHGMDEGFNSAAYSRAVVVHGADYVSKSFINGQGRLGRSWGCPAVSRDLAPKLINLIKDRTVMFVYAPQEKYLASSQWLNKKIDRVEDVVLERANTSNATATNGATKTIAAF